MEVADTSKSFVKFMCVDVSSKTQFTLLFLFIVILQHERDHLGDPEVDGWIILRWIFRKWDVGVWTGSSWYRIGTGGWHL
jgi:hypothetical protein